MNKDEDDDLVLESFVYWKTIPLSAPGFTYKLVERVEIHDSMGGYEMIRNAIMADPTMSYEIWEQKMVDSRNVEIDK